jgi:hypothetical protein
MTCDLLLGTIAIGIAAIELKEMRKADRATHDGGLKILIIGHDGFAEALLIFQRINIGMMNV